MAKRRVCRVADVPENTLKEFEAEGLKLVVANAGGEFVGFQAMCPHQDVPLCEGLFDGQTLTCHMHLWQWDVRTGAPQGIAETPLERYPLVREGDALYLGGESGALDVGELFNGLNSSLIEKLSALARKESHAAGATLYRPGDAADDFFGLDSGQAGKMGAGIGQPVQPVELPGIRQEGAIFEELLEAHILSISGIAGTMNIAHGIGFEGAVEEDAVEIQDELQFHFKGVP